MTLSELLLGLGERDDNAMSNPVEPHMPRVLYEPHKHESDAPHPDSPMEIAKARIAEAASKPPNPRVNLECEESVILKIRQRRDIGRRKYGTSMERTDLTEIEWLSHAQEEAMDLAIYLEKLIQVKQKHNELR